jgi:hypothetical protein
LSVKILARGNSERNFLLNFDKNRYLQESFQQAISRKAGFEDKREILW